MDLTQDVRSEVAEDEYVQGDRPMLLDSLKFFLNAIAAQAPQAPIVIVGTHLDQISDKMQCLENLRMLESGFEGAAFESQLVGTAETGWTAGDYQDHQHDGYVPMYTHCVSSVTGEGLDNLRITVDTIVHGLDGFGDIVSLSWLKVLSETNRLMTSITKPHVAAGVLKIVLKKLCH